MVNSKDVFVLLQVGILNCEKQLQAIRKILRKLDAGHITPKTEKECRELLMKEGVDLFAPVRKRGK